MVRFLWPTLGLGLGLSLLVSCQTLESRNLPIPVSSEALIGKAVRGWEAFSARGERLGLLVRFEATHEQEVHFMVRNIWHQDLGLIDANGRAYRFLPHSKDPSWVGTGTVPEGVERVLGNGPCSLVEVPLQEPEAPRTPGERERRRITAVPRTAAAGSHPSPSAPRATVGETDS